jgi:hypothetical protein
LLDCNNSTTVLFNNDDEIVVGFDYSTTFSLAVMMALLLCSVEAVLPTVQLPQKQKMTASSFSSPSFTSLQAKTVLSPEQRKQELQQWDFGGLFQATVRKKKKERRKERKKKTRFTFYNETIDTKFLLFLLLLLAMFVGITRSNTVLYTHLSISLSLSHSLSHSCTR